MKHSTLRFGLSGLGIVLLAVGILAPPQNRALATTMSPTRVDLDADPGAKTQTSIKIYNDDKVKRTFYLSAATFETKDETGQPEFVWGDKEGLVSWLSLASSVEIGPQQSKEVPVFVTVPENAQPGGYFAAVFASIIPPADRDSGTVAIQSDVGTLVLFRVNGEFPKDDAIIEFDVKNKKHWHANLPVEFYFRFQNSGADRAQPLGDITVKNLFGGIAKIITANRGAGNVLPKSIRRFESAWVTSGGGKTEENNGTVEYPKFSGFVSHVKYEWNNFAFGRYRADLNVTVNNDASRSHAKSLVFWIVPWHLLLVISAVALLFFGVVLAAVLIIVLLILRYRRR